MSYPSFGTLMINSKRGDLTDQDLVNRVLNHRDELAFEELYHRYYRRVHQLCESIVHDREVAKDLTQEAFIKMYDRLSTYEGKSALFTWMYPIARNHTYDFLRKQKPIDSIDDHEGEFLEEEPADEELMALERAKLQRALKSISAFDREILIQKYGYQWPIEEIAEYMGLNDGAVKMRLMRAKAKVKTAYLALPD